MGVALPRRRSYRGLKRCIFEDVYIRCLKMDVYIRDRAYPVTRLLSPIRGLEMDVYIRDHAYPVTRLLSPILVKFGASNESYRNYQFCNLVNFLSIRDRAISDPRSRR